MELAHEVGVDVERAIKSRIPEVRDVVVHLEPKDYCDNKEIPI
jgi:divalent metal cation (Fe/Co/Zn/Cd) transporter